eukprot:625872-Rhodomonas_salina.1
MHPPPTVLCTCSVLLRVLCYGPRWYSATNPLEYCATDPFGTELRTGSRYLVVAGLALLELHRLLLLPVPHISTGPRSPAVKDAKSKRKVVCVRGRNDGSFRVAKSVAFAFRCKVAKLTRPTWKRSPSLASSSCSLRSFDVT